CLRQIIPSEPHVTGHNLSRSTAVMDNWNASSSHSFHNRYSKMFVFSAVDIGHCLTQNVPHLPQRRENKRDIFGRDPLQPLVVGRSFIRYTTYRYKSCLGDDFS